MNREVIEQKLAEAVERLRAEGDSWWPGAEIAPIAFRRLSTFSRRQRTRHTSDEDRIRDLVKGLQSHFEPGVPYTHPTDWRCLATELVRVFMARTDPRHDRSQ